MNTSVLFAVFRRNFVSYFASPTGYVFICLFVLLSALAAFWPNEFFNANLANLDQLSNWFPYIMLFFIPAITMSIWAQERQQGTDELLLTIPAGDFEVVLGKYLAAVAIYSLSLLFSLFCNYLVLNNLASSARFALLPAIDLGLFVGTYMGYWLIGLAMLAIGMVASFLTSNLTIAFILGALFNSPLVFLAYVDSLWTSQVTLAIKRWSIAEQLREFGRGVISLSGIVYFLVIMAAMLYLCMVLIGRRHWLSGRKAGVMVVHYLVRVLALVVVAVAVTVLCQHTRGRVDATAERLNTLSPSTRKLLADLSPERPVQIEAFISPVVPESYVQTRANLLAMLGELRARGGDKVKVQITDTEPSSEEARRAEQLFGITPRQVLKISSGAQSMEDIFMGVAMTCGLQKVVVPFIDRGIPAEYELVRSLCTVSQQKRKKVGVLKTDAPLYGGFDMRSRSSNSNWPIIDEMEKQYEVVPVDPAQPITQKYDVLLAVQPSSLGPEEMNRFIEAIENGQATAIFEDPLPAFVRGVPATSMPRQPPGGMDMMMMMGRQQVPKGDVNKLWRLLGVDFANDQIVWQDYNPLPKLGQLREDKELVFLDATCGARFDPDNAVSSGLQHLLLPFPGCITKLHSSSLDFEPLVKTGDKVATGTSRFRDIMEMSQLNRKRPYFPQNTSYVLAAYIHGKTKPAQSMAAEDDPADKKEGEKKPKEANINVVLVADLDMLSPSFFEMRERGDVPELGIRFDFDNVTFVLNTLDELAGDDRFIEIRKRRPAHRTLTRIEHDTEEAKKNTTKAREKFTKDYQENEEKLRKELTDKVDEMKKRLKDGQADVLDIAQQAGFAMQEGQRRLDATLEQSRHERDQEIKRSNTELDRKVNGVRSWYKTLAVVLPPIPPLVVGVIVLFTRRAREREGVARSRLR